MLGGCTRLNYGNGNGGKEGKDGVKNATTHGAVVVFLAPKRN